MALGLHFIPLIVALLFPLIFAVAYVMALKNERINPAWAYISDTGTNPPEQCVFGLGLSIAMVFVGATAYIRYKQVAEFIRTKAGSRGQSMTRLLNNVGLFFGLMSAFGTAVVGAFQETSVLIVHMIGAFMIFGGGAIFLIIEGILTLRMVPTFGSKGLGWFRILVGVACLVLFFVCIFTGIASMKEFVGDDSLKWERDHGGWTLRIISTSTEWASAVLFDLYFLTFIPEFKRIAFVPPQFQLVEVSTVRGKGNAGSSTVMHHPVNNGGAAD